VDGPVHRGCAGPTGSPSLVYVLDETIRNQCGAITRGQALAAGMSVGAIRSRLDGGRWQALFRSTYATFSGPVPRDCLLWAAVLYAGDGAVVSHESAAELVGLADQPSELLHVTVATERKVRRAAGIVVHRSNRAIIARHPLRTPPQTRIEETVVDLTQVSATLEEAIGWAARACGRRLTRPDRIREGLTARKKVRWREELLATLTDVASGAQSSLELRYLRDVERAHRLPRGSRQHAVRRPGGQWYDDVRYARFGVTVELDGRAAHPDEARWRDMRRDNAAAVDGRRVLRYGWTDVAGQPCAVAAQVATVLRASGWTGMARRCGPHCSMITESSCSQGYQNFP
jgi:very-short-patch-repair endonuclease